MGIICKNCKEYERFFATQYIINMNLLPKITLVSTGGWIIWVLTKTEIQASALTDPASLVRTQVYLPSSDDLKQIYQKIRKNLRYDFLSKVEKQTITDLQCGNSWQFIKNWEIKSNKAMRNFMLIAKLFTGQIILFLGIFNLKTCQSTKEIGQKKSAQ